MLGSRRGSAAAAGLAAGALLASASVLLTLVLLTPALADPSPTTSATTTSATTMPAGPDVKALAPTPLDVDVFAGGTAWVFTNSCGTDNGLPTGGSANNTPGLAIFDATTSSALTDAFDCGAMVWIGSTVVADDDGTVDVSPSGADEVVTPLTQTIAGLRVTDSYRLFASGDTARVLVKLENPTAAAVTTPVSYVSNFGSDASTVLAGSSSGGATFTTADRWIVTSDDPTAGGDLMNTAVFAGPGAAVLRPSSVSSTVFASATTDGALATFDVTVPAGATRYLMFFQVVTGGGNGTPNAAAVATAAVWNTNLASGSPLLAGIPPADVTSILNWAVAGPASAPAPASVPAAAAVGVVPTFTG
jgi:hypothetical protein